MNSKPASDRSARIPPRRRLHSAPGRLLRVGLASTLLPSAFVLGQLPASAPPASSSQAAANRAQHRSEITFTDGLLTVDATNASLNNIVREIARQTGMKVSGSVAEDRVFGTYGPADPQRVLAALLDGTGSNFLIVSSSSDVPVSLVLTPRTGAATPPNPNAATNANDDEDDQAPTTSLPAGNAPRSRPIALPGSVPAPAANLPANSAATQPSTTDQTVVFPRVDGTSTPSTASSTPMQTDTPSENTGDSVKTPQQIFEQLQRMRQQQPAGTPAPPQ